MTNEEWWNEILDQIIGSERHILHENALDDDLVEQLGDQAEEVLLDVRATLMCDLRIAFARVEEINRHLGRVKREVA